MFKYLLSSLFLFLLLGCSNKTIEYSKKQYKNVDKNVVLNAAKRVILLTDKKFKIHAKRNEIKAEKTNIKFTGFGANVNVNNITLSAVLHNKTTNAILTISKKVDYEKKEIFVQKSVHDLFWSRVDYILGINKTWDSCEMFSKNNEGVLCDYIYNKDSNVTSQHIIHDTKIHVLQEKIKNNSIELIKIDLSVLDNIILPNNKIIKKKTTQDLNKEKL